MYMQHRLVRTLLYTLFIMTILPLLAASGTAGENEETAALARQIEELRQKVERLDAKVGELERRLSGEAAQRLQDAANTGTSSPPAGEEESPGPAAEGAAQPRPGESLSAPDTDQPSIPQRWRTLKRGMTAEAVEALLGRPQRVMEVDTNTVWYYRYPNLGAGSVVFTPDRLVSGWQKPPFHGWW